MKVSTTATSKMTMSQERQYSTYLTEHAFRILNMLSNGTRVLVLTVLRRLEWKLPPPVKLNPLQLRDSTKPAFSFQVMDARVIARCDEKNRRLEILSIRRIEQTRNTFSPRLPELMWIDQSSPLTTGVASTEHPADPYSSLSVLTESLDPDPFNTWLGNYSSDGPRDTDLTISIRRKGVGYWVFIKAGCLMTEHSAAIYGAPAFLVESGLGPVMEIESFSFPTSLKQWVLRLRQDGTLVANRRLFDLSQEPVALISDWEYYLTKASGATLKLNDAGG